MRLLHFVICFLALALKAQSQISNDIHSLRYEDDFSDLKKDSTLSAYQQMKFMPLSKNKQTYFSFGGDIRYQYYKVTNENWGDIPNDRDGYTLSRFLAHADFHAGEYFRFFFQIQSSNANSRIDADPVENNPLDVHQAFFDVQILNTPDNHLIFRLGRQEMRYGSQRLVSVRELPNSRRAFDGAKLIFKDKNWALDLFYSHPVHNNQEIFDDHFNKDTKFWGSYSTVKNIPFFQNVDLYYMGIWNRKAVFDDATGEEMRHSLGTRIWNGDRNFLYDIEGVYQFGTLGSSKIKAWTISASLSKELEDIKFSPVLGLKTELISGNRHYGDTSLETFNPMFPMGAYFGLAALIGPANLFDLHPSIDMELTPKFSFSFDYDLFWRLSPNDGIYSVNVQLIYTGKDTQDQFIGSQYTCEFKYSPVQLLILKLEGTWFDSGGFIKESGAGKDTLIGGITAQFKF
ncbi:alginate export family protein [Flavobacterium sp. 3-210]